MRIGRGDKGSIFVAVRAKTKWQPMASYVVYTTKERCAAM